MFCLPKSVFDLFLVRFPAPFAISQLEVLFFHQLFFVEAFIGIGPTTIVAYIYDFLIIVF